MQQVYEVKSDRLIAELFLQRFQRPGRFAESKHVRDRRAEAKASMGDLQPFWWMSGRARAKQKLKIVKRKAAAKTA